MKTWARALIRRFMRGLPWGIQNAAFNALIERFGSRELLERLAMREKITLFGCDGDYGQVVSLCADRAVFAGYSRSGSWARTANDFFIDFFAGRGGTYLDIGANIGLTTIPVARNPDVKCIAFEPDPANYRNLVYNLHGNVPNGNFETHQVALFDRKETLMFSLASDGNLGDHRIGQEPGGRQTIQVQGVRLDDFIGAVTSPLAAKIDVQGAEPFVLDGGEITLAKLDAVVMEFSPFHMAKLNANGEKVINYLRGFRKLAIVEGDQDLPIREIPFGPSGPVVDQLRVALQEWAKDEFHYVDVYGIRLD